MPTAPMPAAFLGHGSPMNTLAENRYTAAWRAFGASLPAKPRAVLVLSAHWYLNATAVTAMAQPRTIHDFYGFPDALFRFRYPAPGSPEVAREVAEALAPEWVGLDAETWGLDHGAWSVLAHVFPEADVPVVQLSINAAKKLEEHMALGARLAALRRRGVLVLGSGDVVHNLRRIDFHRPDAAYDWASRFDAAARDVMTRDPSTLAALARHADYALAVPTPEHFLPLAYLAGIASAEGTCAEVLVEGCSLGSISMTCYTLGANVPGSVRGEAAAARLPDPSIVPSEDTNT
ncbi:MAG TPA: 4,5-DOPA dioxygenase extradiol [Usitatibacter sp.]|nr:4,5-DOPA dioxygenase extradiol [Usitatibacter sp.]